MSDPLIVRLEQIAHAHESDRHKTTYDDHVAVTVREALATITALSVSLQVQKDNRNRDLTTLKHIIQERDALAASYTQALNDLAKLQRFSPGDGGFLSGITE